LKTKSVDACTHELELSQTPLQQKQHIGR